MSKLAMKLFENKEECCGCTACYSVCPTSAISMQQDEEGAYYPVIEQSRCIGCRKCERVCSFKKALKTQDASSDAPKVYAARIKDEKELTASTVVIPIKNPDFLLKIDNRSIRIIKMLVSVGAKEETVNGPRFNESIASMIKKATKGEKLVIQADVMMPDGKPKSVTYTATLR